MTVTSIDQVLKFFHKKQVKESEFLNHANYEIVSNDLYISKDLVCSVITEKFYCSSPLL